MAKHAPPTIVRRQLAGPYAAGGGYAGILERQRNPTRGGADPEVAVPAAIQGGASRMVELTEKQLMDANLAQRMAILRAMIDAPWTGSSEEETILRVLRTTPLEQAAQLASELKKPYKADESFYDALERVVDLGNNLELHAELTRVKVKAMGAKKGISALVNAPVLPYHDVMGFFELDATFSLKYTSSGKVIVDYAHEGPLRASERFGPEMRELGSMIFDPEQILIIHDYDTGRWVPFTAGDLVGYTNERVRTFLGHAATVASMATPIGAAKTAVGKAALVIVEKALPLLIAVVEENRLNLVEWFPKWGPRMIYFSDLANAGLGLYGLGRFVLSAGKFFKEWQDVRAARRLWEGGEAGVEAEKVAAALEKEADEIFNKVSEFEKAEQASAQAAAVAPPSGPAQPTIPGKAAKPAAPLPAAAEAAPPETISGAPKPAGPTGGPSFEDISKELGLEKPGTVKPPPRRTEFEPFTRLKGVNTELAADAIKRLESQTGLKLRPDRVLEAPWAGRIRRAGGKATSQTTSAGWERNESRFWTAFDDAFKEDAKLMGPGRTVTPELAKKYGWPDDVIGDTLVHHHIDDGQFTVALPVSRHGAAGYYSTVHPKVTITH
jgi:hypothetical protein